jgi:hypothetical protein
MRRCDRASKEIDMQYLLMLYLDEGGWPKLTPAEQQQGVAAYQSFAEALAKAGAMKDSGRLQPSSTATRVTKAGGKARVMDGPYADTKEQLGGYFLIDVPNLDDALKWAARCPAADHGVVEVRPVWVM